MGFKYHLDNKEGAHKTVIPETSGNSKKERTCLKLTIKRAKESRVHDFLKFSQA